MANTSSAKKTIRSSAKKKLSNDNLRENIRSARKSLVDALKSGKPGKKASKALSVYYKSVDKAAKKRNNVISQNKAARLKSAFATKLSK